MPSAGNKVRASDIPDGAVETYTPDWTASTTDPTNYTASGWYTQLGSWTFFHATFVPGASFTAGSGNYIFELPSTQSANIGLDHAIGTVHFRDQSGTARYIGTLMPTGSSSGHVYALFNIDDASGKASLFTHAWPVAPANTDVVCIEGFYFED